MRLLHDPFERRVIGLFAEQGQSTVRAVEHVANQAALNRASTSRHAQSLATGMLPVKGNDSRPLFPSKGAGSGRIHVATLDFMGTLTVCDLDIVLGRVRHGIGPSKSFGCGLLLLRRA